MIPEQRGAAPCANTKLRKSLMDSTITARFVILVFRYIYISMSSRVKTICEANMRLPNCDDHCCMLPRFN